MPSLFVVRGRDSGRHFILQPHEQKIGREASSDIQLLDSEVSRDHAVLVPSESGFRIVDRGSSNGTFVNGEQVSQHQLKTGDRVQVGRTMMIYTGIDQPDSVDAEHGVDIVHQARGADESQIVSSIRRQPDLDPLADDDSVVRPSADRDLEVLYSATLAVGRTLDIPELLERILDLVFHRVSADRGCIMLLDPRTGELKPAARRNRKDAEDASRMAISRTILDYVISREEAVRTSNASDDARFQSAASILQMGIREALCVPMKGRYGTVGAIYTDTFISPGQFVHEGSRGRLTDQHLRLVTAIAHQAALAIEDTWYYSAMVQSERLAAIGQTIATVSHHVKNILQGIRGGGYLIEMGLERSDTDAVRRGWRIVEKNQEKISNLVLDMLTFSKERKPEPVRADLNETVREVHELMLARAADHCCTLDFCPSEEMPDAYFDPDAMHRAILNIVTNAIDAVQGVTDARVVVETRFEPGKGWCIEVRDNGPGIPEEDQKHIFSLFESSKGARGTGFGLPVSRKILNEHAGDIELESQPGHGTRFRMWLPATEEEGDPGIYKTIS